MRVDRDQLPQDSGRVRIVAGGFAIEDCLGKGSGAVARIARGRESETCGVGGSGFGTQLPIKPGELKLSLDELRVEGDGLL